MNKRLEIPLESLIFKNDFDFRHIFESRKSLRAILIDHNIPALTQTFLKDFVEEIVDHHADATEGYYGEG